jgi:hypothetical protein
LVFPQPGPATQFCSWKKVKITTEPLGKGMLTLVLHLRTRARSGAFQRGSNKQHRSGAISSIVPCLAQRKMKNRFYECFTRIEAVEVEFW